MRRARALGPEHASTANPRVVGTAGPVPGNSRGRSQQRGRRRWRSAARAAGRSAQGVGGHDPEAGPAAGVARTVTHCCTGGDPQEWDRAPARPGNRRFDCTGVRLGCGGLKAGLTRGHRLRGRQGQRGTGATSQRERGKGSLLKRSQRRLVWVFGADARGRGERGGGRGNKCWARKGRAMVGVTARIDRGASPGAAILR